MRLNDAEGMAKSIDPDQTAPSLIRVHPVCPGLTVQKLRMCHVMRKPVYFICKQQRRRPACAAAQSDQCLYCSMPE